MRTCYFTERYTWNRFRMLLSVSLLVMSFPLLAHAREPRKIPAFELADYNVLNPIKIPKFVQPLVIPPVMPYSDDQKADYNIAMRQFQQQILPGGIWKTQGPQYPATTVWSYGKAEDPYDLNFVAPRPLSEGITFNYPAFTIEATQKHLTRVRWLNELYDPETSHFLPHLLSIDRTLHWANPELLACRDGSTHTDCKPDPSNGKILLKAYDGPVPIVTHVHGAHVNPESDGYPEAWWLPNANNLNGYATKGGLYDQWDRTNTSPGSALFGYYNSQRASTLWYHDHGLGITRLNVYAGPAGFWLIRGPGDSEPDLLSGVLPGPAPALGEDPNFDPVVRAKIREVPIVIQDRTFTPQGQLFFPDNRAYFEGLNKKKKNNDMALDISFTPQTAAGGEVSDVAPIWNPEFFGNTMVVNGTTWPFYKVAPAKYRLRLLNGCNARTLILKMIDSDSLTTLQTAFTPESDNAILAEQALKFFQIGSDGGLLPGRAVPLKTIRMMPAERADVILDFSKLPHGSVLYMINEGPDEPFGGGEPGVDFAPSNPFSTGMVMKFVVDQALLNSHDNAVMNPRDLTFTNINSLSPVKTRRVSLNELESESVHIVVSGDDYVLDDAGNVSECIPGSALPEGEECVPFGPTEAKVGVVEEDPDSNGYIGIPLSWTDMTGTSDKVKVFTKLNGSSVLVPVTEMPNLNDTEEWEIWNFTMDAHPIHLHLVEFQVVNRQVLKPTKKNPSAFKLTNKIRTRESWETGWKDTVISYPGEVTRIRARFDTAGLYVWHCHIIDHEDNEMMRPYAVVPDLDQNNCVDYKDLAILTKDILHRGNNYDLNADGKENALDLLRLGQLFTNRLGALCR